MSTFTSLIRVCVAAVSIAAAATLLGCGGGASGGGGGNPPPPNPPPSYPGNRTDFIWTDDTPNSAVYDPVHNLVFASEPDLGVVDAISVANGQIEAKILAPGVFALRITPDSTKVLASTSTQQVAWIDTTLLRVVQWEIVPQAVDPVAGLQYFSPYTAAVTANGKVLFEALEGGFTSVLVEWDPVANTAVVRRDGPGGSIMASSANGTEVFFASGPTIYDSATDGFRTSTAFGYIAMAAANPDGTQFALLTADSITFIDAQFNILGKVPGGASGLVYSADGKYAYITTLAQAPALTTIDAQSFQVLGSAPAYYDPSSVETPLSADGTGLVFGSASGGLVLDDSTNFQNLPSTPGEPLNDFISPSEGPIQGGTQTTLDLSQPNVLPDVWFGSQHATNESLGSGGVQAKAPPAKSVGTVNVKIVFPNGTMDIIPQGFTYGSVPLSPAPLAAAPGGGTLADIIGFGFSADISGASRQVTIGGANANIVHSSQLGRMPLQDLTVQVPPGASGAAANIVVTSPSGTGTLTQAFHYLKSVTDYPTKDALQNILHDQQRQRLYLNAGDHIDVFSLTQNAFTTSIVPPSLGGTRQLTGMALTPDGSKLLVGNFSDDSLAIINPDNPASATAVQIVPTAKQGHYQLAPYQVATTSKNTVFVATSTPNLSGGGGQLYELDLGTMQVSLRTDPGLGCLQIAGNYIAASSDGTQAYMAEPGASSGCLVAWSAATDAWQFHNLGGLFSFFYNDAAASRDGNVFAVNNDFTASDFPYPMMINAQLNQVSQLGIESVFSAENEPGMALHDSGSLLYSSTNYGVDIIDVLHGALAERILLNEQDSFVNGSLAVDQTGQNIFLVTNAGLTIIELDAVPVSIGSVTPSAGGAGALIKIRGSGFQANTSVTFNGTAAGVTYVDHDTLQVSVPSIATGPAQIVISNPGDDSYSLDSAFTVQ